MNEQVLLTGATGYLGRYVVRHWLRYTPATLHLLVREKHGVDARHRLHESLRPALSADELERDQARLRVWRGDVTLPHLGLESGEYAGLTKLTTHVIHVAAAARFDLPLDQARATNVAGVEHLLTLARSAVHLKRFDHIGTAYVAGCRRGLVREHELACGQSHRNSYERSKFEAEGLLHDAMRSLPVMVARPSMILCDTESGVSSNYAGFTRTLQAYAAGRLTMLPGSPTGLLDFVPVDYVAAVLFRLWRNPDSLGRTYHLVAGPDATLTVNDLRDLAAATFGRPPFAIVPPALFDSAARQKHVAPESPAARLLTELQLYAPYLNCKTAFDCASTARDARLMAPHPATYFGRFAEWIAGGQTAGFGIGHPSAAARG